jgi:demethylmenaquinone methyltransferase/2-methoxy-6-polyprenyl-1,4-benzoquinol methylase
VHGDVWPFDRFARLYDLLMPGPDPETIRRGLDRARRPVERVLDVGGGPGRALRVVDAPVRAVVDPAGGMVRQARRHGLGAVRADGACLPVRTASVDAVLVTDALHHVGDQRGLLAEAARVLRPGGVLLVREFDPTTLRGRGLVAAERLVGFDSTFYPPDRLASMVAEAGLTASVVERGFGYTVTGRARADAREARVPSPGRPTDDT